MKPQPEYRIYLKGTDQRAGLPSGCSYDLSSPRDYSSARAAQNDIEAAHRVLKPDYLLPLLEKKKQAERLLAEVNHEMQRADRLQTAVEQLFRIGLEIRRVEWKEEKEEVIADVD